MSRSAQATKKYSCRSRSSFPFWTLSYGERTFEIVSDPIVSWTAWM